VSDKPRLIWNSNSPLAGTGYAVQTALFAPRLKDKWNIAIAAFYGVEGSPISFQGVPVYPGLGQTYGNETIRDHASVHFGGDLRGGLTFTLQDVWVLNPAIWREMNSVHWTPIDHEPCPPPISGYFHATAAVPIAMSRFGEEQLRNAGVEPLYCPHGVDTSTYKPVPKAEAREATNIPKDAFVVGMVAANKGNPPRKCFMEAFQAFKAFRDRHPEAILYLHTEMSGKFDGVNIPEAIDLAGVDRSSVVFCDQYRVVHYPFPPETMAKIYSSFDVLLMASGGEGFGVPTVEAQACGVPVIVSDFSAQPELVGAGWTVSGTRHYTPLKAWQFIPNVEDMVAALEAAYGRSRAERREDARKARKLAESYDVERVLHDHMIPALDAAWENFEARKPMKLEPVAA
jgi:glycosyltransferase involved in cell wall biosynthesis